MSWEKGEYLMAIGLGILGGGFIALVAMGTWTSFKVLEPLDLDCSSESAFYKSWIEEGCPGAPGVGCTMNVSAFQYAIRCGENRSMDPVAQEEDKMEIIKPAVALVKIDKVTHVACGSNSMGLSMGCNDKLYLHELRDEEELIEGEIYVFRNPYSKDTSSTVVHRLVRDCSDNCTGYIFKGDNNVAADPPISREDVIYKVVRVEYG